MSTQAVRLGSDNCDLLLMTFRALPVTFPLLGLVPLCGPCERCLSTHGELSGLKRNKYSKVRGTRSSGLLKRISNDSAFVHKNL